MHFFYVQVTGPDDQLATLPTGYVSRYTGRPVVPEVYTFDADSVDFGLPQRSCRALRALRLPALRHRSFSPLLRVHAGPARLVSEFFRAPMGQHVSILYSTVSW